MNLDQLRRASDIAERLGRVRRAATELQGAKTEVLQVWIGYRDPEANPRRIEVDKDYVLRWLERLEAAWCEDLLRLGVMP